ncbi:MAG TPA: hypothetical protein VF601_04805 [Beijerinckiaceae bacterium]|jgi:hypothetical protein
MSRTIAAVACAALVATAAGSLVVLPGGATRASGKDANFLIPAADGYGVADCLTARGSECGRVIADAYCESQGFARSASFGRAAADDLTGAVPGSVGRPESERPILIACSN